MLVNNAGIAYATNGVKPTQEEPFKSAQGYDKLFATNYLGHFLLTEMLLTTLTNTPKARVVQVSSGAHWHSDGQDLLPIQTGVSTSSQNNLIPPAARGDLYTDEHYANSYPSSKIAQIAHAYKLQSLLNSRSTADTSTDLKV